MDRLIGLIIFSLLLTAGAVQAQPPKPSETAAIQMLNPFTNGFNPGTISKVTGKIKKINDVKDKMIPTVAAIIDTKNGIEYEVRLGPTMFIRKMQNFCFRKGTKMEVVGSQIEKQDQRAVIIAMKIIIKGNETVLRDENGVPVWASVSQKSGGGIQEIHTFNHEDAD
jgi:hypothetical protein